MSGTCAATACTRTAANATQATVQASVNAASAQEVVCVPATAGTSWSTPVDITAKDLTLKGTGIGSTIINLTSGQAFILDNSRNNRVCGFDFRWSAHADWVALAGLSTTGKVIRVDHNNFTAVTTSDWSIINFENDNVGKHHSVLFDNNTLSGYAVHNIGTVFGRIEGPYQDQIWAQIPPKGSWPETMIIEDNTYTGGDMPNFGDGNYAQRRVVRFNTFNMTGNGTTGNEIHSIQGNNRAPQWWEIYNNFFNKPSSSFYPAAYIRGGSGFIFNNASTTAYTSGQPELLINNVRSCRDPGDTSGKCDGTSNWDQNTGGQFGYACRDQLGRGSDTSIWSIGAAYTEPTIGAYFFNNIRGASTPWQHVIDPGEACPGTGGDLNPTHIQANRDFYIQGASFNGATGVGTGTLASRPATCTTGVAYWATDQGNWNTSTSNSHGAQANGASGVLYECSATNTWTIYYTPYTYPHPLQGGVASTTGAAVGGKISHGSAIRTN